MLTLKIKPLPRAFVRPANPAYSLMPQGLRLYLYADVSNRLRGLLVSAAAILLIAAFGYWGSERIDSATLAATAMLCALAFGVIAFGAKIASSQVYFLAPGQPFPIISRLAANEPRATDPPAKQSFWRKLPLRGASKPSEHEFNFALRETAPNAAHRLKAYAKDTGPINTIKYDATQVGLQHFLEDSLPNRSRVKRVLSAHVGAEARRRDLWPIARLIISRVVYKRPRMRSRQREIGEELEPLGKGEHVFLSYKLHLPLLSAWFLLLATAILAVQSSIVDGRAKEVSAALIVATIIWAAWCVYYNKQVLMKWARWLGECEHKPLDDLPLYLFVPHNEQAFQWEELDEHDFRLSLNEYVMQTDAMFNLIVGTFAAITIAIIPSLA